MKELESKIDEFNKTMSEFQVSLFRNHELGKLIVDFLYRLSGKIVFDLILIVIKSGEIVFVNKEWYDTMGYTEDEVIGVNFMKFLAPDDVERTLKEFDNVKKFGMKHDFTNHYIKKDGSKIKLKWVVDTPSSNACVFALAKIEDND